MKKAKCYTCRRAVLEDGTKVPVMVLTDGYVFPYKLEGYSGDHLFVYKAKESDGVRTIWTLIEPITGLSLTVKDTRADCEFEAFQPTIADRLIVMLREHPDRIENLRKLHEPYPRWTMEEFLEWNHEELRYQ